MGEAKQRRAAIENGPCPPGSQRPANISRGKRKAVVGQHAAIFILQRALPAADRAGAVAKCPQSGDAAAVDGETEIVAALRAGSLFLQGGRADTGLADVNGEKDE